MNTPTRELAIDRRPPYGWTWPEFWLAQYAIANHRFDILRDLHARAIMRRLCEVAADPNYSSAMMDWRRYYGRRAAPNAYFGSKLGENSGRRSPRGRRLVLIHFRRLRPFL